VNNAENARNFDGLERGDSFWDVALPCKGMLEEPPQRELRTDPEKSEVQENHSITDSKFNRLVLYLSNL
jgi:hypothetical protein